MSSSESIGIIGLGYVGLPLAETLARRFSVIGFDVKADRVEALQNGFDETGEVESEALAQETLRFTACADDLKACTFLIVTVPTPITDDRIPDLSCLERASETVGRILQKGVMVVYESTVYPGVTEEVCLPILEKESGLQLGDFDLGYSPERVNPGDKEHTIERIVKVVSGHNEKALERATAVYGAVVKAGIHSAPNIKTAEAAKVIENIQRDLNIALMNELSIIFSRLGIHTPDVLAAAGTKWNFHMYGPGLVGGHCIGVDPYYLTYRAEQLGYHSQVILAGRRINDGMGLYVVSQLIRRLWEAGVKPGEANVWILGLTFKENVPDLRNTRAVDVVHHLRDHGIEPTAWEPFAAEEDVEAQFHIAHQSYDEVSELDAVILLNGHRPFQEIELSTLRQKMRTPILMDVKNFFDGDGARENGFNYFSL